MIIALITFISCHGGSADHMAAFCEVIPDIKVYANGPAVKKFEDRKIPYEEFQLSENFEVQLALKCKKEEIVVTDVGSPFDIKMQKALKEHAPNVRRYCYYDNPESYVPGGYSKVARDVILASQGVLFSNSNLAHEDLYGEPEIKIDLGETERFGIGFYPLSQVEKIKQRRMNEKEKFRSKILERNGLSENGQKILVYFGGNNEEYFEKAFPAFLEMINQASLDNFIIILQQHPAAKASNRDAKLVEQKLQGNKCAKFIVSDFSSDEAQILADVACYYQTSMAPQFILAGLPVFQIGHETYGDVLVRNGLCQSVTNADQFKATLQKIDFEEGSDDEQTIYKSLGIRPDWKQRLKESLSARN